MPTSSGTIAFLSNEGHVEPAFSAALAVLAQRHPTATLMHLIGTNIAEGRNKAMGAMVGDWLWFIDTDMVFRADVLDRLLAHKVDVVQPLCLQRHPPHYPILYGKAVPGRGPGAFGQGILGTVTPHLWEAEALGTGGMLLKRAVRDAIPSPWFELGTLRADELGEDLAFCKKAKAAGFRLWTDLTTHLGHITSCQVWPMWNGTKWQTGLQIGTAPPIVVEAAAK